MKTPLFITAEDKIHGDDAVAAILVMEDGRYVMQLRDALPQIFYPDHWGCFGGAVNPGEEPLAALYRELREEVEIEVEGATQFARFEFDIQVWPRKVYRNYYEVRVPNDFLSRAVLREGAAIRAFSGVEILQQPRVTPYDAFALWLHYRSLRFR
ncbi:MAG TPA: NUDIX domain-containing protein [Burkholderiales bacterium]|nr:NUDIX domain-containing protein [Burkholderiales bacterium]